jgi:hypothetical protein
MRRWNIRHRSALNPRYRRTVRDTATVFLTQIETTGVRSPGESDCRAFQPYGWSMAASRSDSQWEAWSAHFDVAENERFRIMHMRSMWRALKQVLDGSLVNSHPTLRDYLVDRERPSEGTISLNFAQIDHALNELETKFLHGIRHPGDLLWQVIPVIDLSFLAMFQSARPLTSMDR